jgi:hypothetical protein
VVRVNARDETPTVVEAWPGELGHLRALVAALNGAVQANNWRAVERLLAVFYSTHGRPAGTEASR